MNQHLTTYQQSVELKKIGVPQKSIFTHHFCTTNGFCETFPHRESTVPYRDVVKYSAFTLSELIEVLGEGFGGLRKRENDDMLGKWETHGFWGDSYHASTGEAPISSCVNLILKLHQEGILKFNEKKDE